MGGEPCSIWGSSVIKACENEKQKRHVYNNLQA